jgi:hypothetical protein
MNFRQIPADNQHFQVWRGFWRISFLTGIPLLQIARNVTSVTLEVFFSV